MPITTCPGLTSATGAKIGKASMWDTGINTVGMQIPDKSNIQMVKIYLIPEWFGFQMPFEYLNKNSKLIFFLSFQKIFKKDL